MSNTSVHRTYEPGTGRLDYEFITDLTIYNDSYILRATDRDLADEHPWQSYTVTHIAYELLVPVPKGIAMLMDDGSEVRLEKNYFGGRGNAPQHYQDRWTRWDAEGRLDWSEERTWLAPGQTLGDATYRGLDYDPGSGRLDYSLIRYEDGREEAIDYDLATGNKDYVVTTFRGGRMVAQDLNAATGLLDYVRTVEADGRTQDQDYDQAGRLDYVLTTSRGGQVVAQDWNAATGLLDYMRTVDADGHTLDQDYDQAGSLDYVLERWADGRMLATDYDLENQHAWTSYSIAYDAAGRMGLVTVL